MSQGESWWVGADPGGKDRFGVAILSNGTEPVAGLVSYVDEAVEFIRKRVHGKPAGVGVDAPLWWSPGPSGDRCVDQWLRKRYGLSGGQVQTTNSLRSAAPIQAVMLVQRLRDQFPGVRVTEVHPKALLMAMAKGNWRGFCQRFGLRLVKYNEHQRDAIISAIAAREGFEGRWKNDLSASRHDSEQHPRRYWLTPVHYYWPE